MQLDAVRRRAYAYALLCAVVASVPSLASALNGFSSEESRALNEGRIVVRRAERVEHGHPVFGGTSFQVVNRPQEDVWRAVHDVSNYRYMLPATRSTRVVSRMVSGALLRVEHELGPATASYHLRVRFAEDVREVHFDLDTSRPHDVQSARGFMIVRPYPGDPHRTVITWGAMVGMGDGIFSSMVAPQIHEWLLRVPQTVRAYLEGRARSWYVGQR